MKNDPTDTLALQLLTIKTQNGQRWIFVGTPAVFPADSDSNNPIVDVWFSNIQDVPQNATIRSLVEMMDKQNTEQITPSTIYPPGSKTIQ